MKNRNTLWACFLIFIFFYSCKQNSQDQIIKVFQPEYSFSKPDTTKVYTHGYYESPIYNTGGVSEFQSLYLNNDNSFTLYNLTGSVLVGKWQGAHDTVVLNFAARLEDIISFNLKFSNAVASPFITFVIYDKANRPIPNFLIQPFDDQPDYRYDGSGELITPTQGANKLSGFPDKYVTDSTGTLKLKKTLYDSLDFTKLSYLTRKKFRIGTRNLPDTIKLTININAIALADRRAYLIDNVTMPGYTSLPPMRLFLKGSRFIISFDD